MEYQSSKKSMAINTITIFKYPNYKIIKKWGLMYNKVLVFCLILIIMVPGCSKIPTGKAIAAEPDIYEDAPQIEQYEIEEDVEENQPEEQAMQIKTGEEFYNEIVSDEQPKPKIEEFRFSPESIVSNQHNISLSLDNLKHEIKNEYWGKITGITLTVLNNGSNAFKPKVLVLLYDEEDFKEEWLKPKAEIEFEIEKLYQGEHTTRDAIVNMAFDDIALTKHFKLVLVDDADPANKPIVVVEKEFNPILG